MKDLIDFSRDNNVGPIGTLLFRFLACQQVLLFRCFYVQDNICVY